VNIELFCHKFLSERKGKTKQPVHTLFIFRKLKPLDCSKASQTLLDCGDFGVFGVLGDPAELLLFKDLLDTVLDNELDLASGTTGNDNASGV